MVKNQICGEMNIAGIGAAQATITGKLADSAKIARNASTIGLGLCDVLAVVFIVLKLIGVIDWNWWWVLSPVWIPVIIVVIAYIVISIVD